MSKEVQEIIDRLDRIESKLDSQHRPKIFVLPLPTAAVHLGVSYGWLRGMCIKGVIPSTPMNELERGDDKYQHRLVNITEAERIIKEGGWQVRRMKEFQTK